jgi:uroporphyrinogen-III decarboxylase
LDFSERYFLDPISRTEQDQQAQRLLHERFGALGLGSKDPQPRPHLEICGHRLLPALLGCEVFFQADQPPAVEHLPVDSVQEMAAIRHPDLTANRWALEFQRQGKALLDRYGQVDAEINHGGPLNVASNMLGAQAFLYLAEPGKELRAFLQMIAELCLETYDQLTLPFNPHLDPARQLFLGNCPVMMLDPQTYRREVLPADLYLRHHVKRFGLHHCGPMDRYLADYQALGPCDYIEVGWGSTLARVRQAFPATALDLMINIPAVQTMSPDRLKETLREMVSQAAPRALIRDIFMADIGPDVPDATVEAFVDAVNEAFGLADSSAR